MFSDSVVIELSKKNSETRVNNYHLPDHVAHYIIGVV